MAEGNGAASDGWDYEKKEWKSFGKRTLWFSWDGKSALEEVGDSIRIHSLADGGIMTAEKLPSGRRIIYWGGTNRPYWMSWSPDDQWFAVETRTYELAIFRRDGSFFRYLNDFQGGVQFAPDHSRRLASTQSDQTVRVWNFETGQQLWCGVQLSPDAAAILNDQGEIVAGDSEAAERELIYMLEYDDGRTAVLTPSEFKKQFPRNAPGSK